MFALKNQATGDVVADHITQPKGWYGRTLGLLNRTSLDANEGLWLDRCWGVHTVGMKFPIDVVFLDDEFRIVGIRANVHSGRLAIAQANANHVVELAAGTCENFDLLCGDRMAFVASAPRSKE